MRTLAGLTVVTLLLFSLSVAQRSLPILDTGVSIADSLTAHTPLSYSIKVDKGRFVYGEVDQVSVDVVVKVFDPAGTKVLEVDGPARGAEPFQFTTAVSGTYRVEVSPFEEGSGRYAIIIRTSEPVATTPEGRVNQLMARYNRPDAPGGVVAVEQKGSIIFSKGYGQADLEFNAPNTPKTSFHLASVSKQFTAFAIVLLEQDGKLSLDDEARKYIPELPDFGHRITLRHLLNHTSGLRDQWNLWIMSGGRMDDVIRQKDLLTLIEKQRELNFVPGAEYSYCNSGYMLLSEVVSRVSGLSYREFMKQRVFTPLGMTVTQIYDDHERIVPGRAYSYGMGPDGYRKSVLSYANAGATSQFSTAEDLAKWLDNWRTGKVGGRAAIQRMQEWGILTKGDTLAYALGVDVRKYRGKLRISHSGGDAGYRSYVAYYPELEAGVIALGNDGSFNAGGIAEDVFDVLFGDRLEPKTPPQQPTPPPASEQPKPWTPSLSALQKYTGRYFSEELETFYVVSLKDSLLIATHRRHGEIRLTPDKKEGTFRGDQFALQEVAFEPNDKGMELFASNGRVRRLRMGRVN